MAKPKAKPSPKKYDAEFRVRVVKTSIEKKLSVEEIRKVYGITQSTWYPWRRVYLEEGEEGLRRYGTAARREKKALPPRAQEKLRQHVLAIKEKYPFFGIARVWQWMMRSLFLPVSYRQVRATLAEAKLLGKPPKKKRQPPKPRRFERARPNELWQSDITEIELAGGLTTYLIGFLDDHSRYLVAWGLYAGYTSELVLEVLRRGFATYGRPAELLTDNGPPYKAWRGTTEFQKVLQKEDVKHILARPHHPETLGKIESFWGQLKKEFVSQTRHKGGLEEMRERLAHWVNWYNFQRFQTEIKCTPAERFFQYQAAMKAEIERRILANEKELALAEAAPSEVIGHSPVGNDLLEVRKEGSEFIVTLGDQVVNRTDLKPEKETTHGSETQPLGETGDGGPGRQGEGVPGAGRAVGGEDDLGGVQGDRNQAPLVLQAGGADGEGDAGGRADAAGPGQEEGSGIGGVESGAGDGVAPAGAPAAGEPAADLDQALPDKRPESAEKEPGKAKGNDVPLAVVGDDGAGSSAGEAAAPSGESGMKEA